VGFVVISIYLARVFKLMARSARCECDHSSLGLAYVASVSDRPFLRFRQGVLFCAWDRPIFVVNLRP